MPRIQEIAKVAGVSPATVSRALRGLQHVNEKTRTRIIEAAELLGYPIELPGAKNSKTNTVGVIAPFVSRWYFAQAIGGVEHALREAGMDVLLYNFTRANGREKIFTNLNLKERVDALIIISLPPTREEYEAILSLNIPVAAIGFDAPEIATVLIDDVHGAKVATQHLIDLGHKQIGLISGSSQGVWDFPVPRNRREGFLTALSEAGLTFDPNLEVHADFSVVTAERAMDDLLSRTNRPTAVFCESDEIAYGAMNSMRKHGLSCPEDISLIGFDGHDMADFANLTTIAQPVQTMGELAAWAVMEKMNKPDTPPKRINLPTTLVVRGSTRAI
jgi:DNA-binding LacI/PurR family transcriptional regulator